MRRNIIDIPKETLEHLYWVECLTMTGIADKLGLSITPVYRSMERHNIKRRPIIEYKRIDRSKLTITESQLRDLYIEKELPIIYIAHQLEVGDKTIRKLLIDYSIPIRSKSEVNLISAPKRSRDKDGHGRNWKGGKPHNSNGYIAVWSPDHPKASRNGYVLEHILVWEEVHGKPVPKGWIVHHLNAIKTDNRPENLTAMKRGEHVNIAKPYKERIRQLETELKELHQLKLTIG